MQLTVSIDITCADETAPIGDNINSGVPIANTMCYVSCMHNIACPDCFRREELLMQSKVWITPDTLDARIDEALENPIVLYETASDRQYSPNKDF